MVVHSISALVKKCNFVDKWVDGNNIYIFLVKRKMNCSLQAIFKGIFGVKKKLVQLFEGKLCRYFINAHKLPQYEQREGNL